jgi:hypothetical protein
MSTYRPGSTYQLQHEVMLSVLHGPYSATLFEACANATEHDLYHVAERQPDKARHATQNAIWALGIIMLELGWPRAAADDIRLHPPVWHNSRSACMACGGTQ